MAFRNTSLGAFVGTGPRLDTKPPVLARLNPRDFARARTLAPAFRAWANYEEFLNERDALFLGYGAAGVTATLQMLALPAFERWSRLTGAPLDLDGLDEFAAHWRWRARHPDALVYGMFGVPRFPERHEVEAAGVQVVRVRPEFFVRWRDDYARTALLETPDLDAYATHVVEDCLPCASRSRRPAVNSK